MPKTKTANAAGTERIAAQIGKGRFANVNSSVANADSTAAKLNAISGTVTGFYPTPPPQFTYLNTLLALNTTAKEKYNTHTDHLGSSAWVTDSLGVAVQHLAYLPWGEKYVNQKTGNFSTIYTFSGKERDEETGYSYFGQRFYDSELSLWISVDPMRGKYPQFSPFVYCANNPIKFTDPKGTSLKWDPKALSTGQKMSWYASIKYARENSPLFAKMYNKLTNSATVYKIMIGETTDGVPAQYNTDTQTLTIRDESSLTSFDAFSEEMFHALQKTENASLYEIGKSINYEFEAKTAKILMAAQGQFVLSTPQENIKPMFDFLLPDGLNLNELVKDNFNNETFKKAYYKYADFYRKWNIKNNYGNANYKIKTEQSPKTLIELLQE